MTDDSIPYLSEATLAALGVTTAEVVASIEAMIVGVEEGTVRSAPKAVMLPEDGRYMMAALAAADEPPVMAVKSVVLNPRNPEQGLPQINGLVTLLDSRTGLPLAILDGNWITAVRTAGLSATAAKSMAREDSRVVAFVGCGVQARSHLRAFCDLFPIDAIRLFGRGEANIERLCNEAERQSLSATVCQSGDEAISEADIVVSSVTYSADRTPFLDANALRPGAFCTITDLAGPWSKASFAVLDQLVIDDLEQESALPNKLAPPELVTGDLSGLVLGRFPGRRHENDRNAFVFRGHAIGDLALSILAYQKASQKSSRDERLP